MYDPAIIWAPAMEKLTAQNGKICIICDGYCYGKDANLAGGCSSFRCLRPASRGRMKTSGNDEVLFSTKHNHAPETEVKKARQITTSDSERMNHAGKWMLVKPREIEKSLSTLDEILYRGATTYLNRNKTKDVTVQTDPVTAKDFSWNSPSLKNSAEKPDAWKHPALKDDAVVPVRITAGKRRRLNKECVWNCY